MRTILCFDMHNLCHRALHTTGSLAFAGVPTGVIYGVLRMIDKEVELLSPDICVFAFDSPVRPGRRGELYPEYKTNRKEPQTPEEIQESKVFYQQINQLHDQVLPDIGYRNILKVEGLEADDIMASLAANRQADDEVVMITNDQDLWQMVGDHVTWRSPTGKVVNRRSFLRDHGIEPSRWADVKAIAGCSSDNVPGIRGVGEITATRYLRGLLEPSSAKAKSITNQWYLVQRNRPLVTLPFEGTPVFDLVEDQVTQKKYNQTMTNLGIRTPVIKDLQPRGFEL